MNLYLLLHPSDIVNISNISFSSSLNRFNAFGHCAELEFGLYLAKMCSRDKYFTTASLTKAPLLEVGVYLILEVRNTLFTDPTLAVNESKVKWENH